MTAESLATALDRIEQGLARLEQAVAARAAEAGELADLRGRHRRLRDTVSQELRQLDLLLANLPQ